MDVGRDEIKDERGRRKETVVAQVRVRRRRAGAEVSAGPRL